MNSYPSDFERTWKAFAPGAGENKKAGHGAWKQASAILPRIELMVLCIYAYQLDAAKNGAQRCRFLTFINQERWLPFMIEAEKKMSELKSDAEAPRKLPDSRPQLWWLSSRKTWKPHWQESEIPLAEQPGYYRRKARSAEIGA